MAGMRRRTLLHRLALGAVSTAAIPGWASAASDHSAVLAAADVHRGAARRGVSWTLTITPPRGAPEALFVQTRGGDFLAEYLSPARANGQRILRRGRNMWFVDPDALLVRPVTPREHLLGSAALGDIASDRWTSDYSVADAQSEGNLLVFTLVARSRQATYDKVILTVDRTTGTAVNIEMRTPVDDTVLKTALMQYRDAAFDGKIIRQISISRGGEITTLVYSDVEFGPLAPSVFLPENALAA